VQDAYRLQLKLFLSEVRQQQLLSSIRSFLKLYTTISIAKLASFMDVDEPTLRVALLTYKHKTHVINNDGSVLSNADVDFYVDDDMVHIADSKTTKRFGDYFIRHISKACDFLSPGVPFRYLCRFDIAG
jgi:translation initiation factor 3 subunit L